MSERSITGEAFYEYLGEHKLMGSRCQSCGRLHLPPRPLCPECYSSDVDWEELGGRGELVAFTTVHIAPTVMVEAGYGRKNPYCTGIVQLEEGPAISAQIMGVDPAKPEQIDIGMPVQVAFVQRGEGEGQRTYLAFEKA
jgi:uncharacterized OB-fold protein